MPNFATPGSLGRCNSVDLHQLDLIAHERARGARGRWARFEAIELRRKATVEMRELRPLMRALCEEQRPVLHMVK
jgi:hypothetical protein